MTDVQFEKLLEKQEARLVKHLGQEMDRRFAEQDARLDKRLAEQDGRIEQRFTEFAGQITRYLDSRFDMQRKEFSDRFDRLETMMEAVTERITDDEAERAALGHQLHRHERWIGQLAKSTNTELSPKLELQPDD